MGLLAWLSRKRPAKILVVEDNNEVLELIHDVLSANDYQVTNAADGLQALACFKKEKFDLMILDNNMPRMTGTELLQLIRVMPEGRNQAVIMLSAEPMLNPIYKAYDEGIVEWIPKPFTAADLLTKVVARLKNLKKEHDRRLPTQS